MTQIPLFALGVAGAAAQVSGTLPPRDGLSVAVDIAILMVAAMLLLVGGGAMLLLLRIRRGMDETFRRLERVDLEGIGRSSRDLIGNLEKTTSVLRSDVERVSSSVNRLSGRIDQASDRLEERIEDFNALLEVAQAEAEDLFVDTAARLRGLRASAGRVIGREGSRGSGAPPRPSPKQASGEEEDPSAA